jgi:hypothetical protein
MRHDARRLALVAALAACCAAPTISAQTAPGPPCAPVAVPARQPQENMLDDEQEARLGDISRAFFEQSTKVIDDPALTGYIQAVGERLLAKLPPSGARFHFAIADSSDTNAMSLPGGWIYLTRKLAALMRNEDELAAVLAHEIGHNATHQHAIATTRAFRKALGITSVRSDQVVERFHEVLESGKSVSGGPSEDDNQDAADRLGLQLLRAAGYKPDAMVAVFDRVTGLKGRKGNWFTDLLGSTPANAKRLRTLAQELAAPCGLPAVPLAAEKFEAWRDSVVRYTAVGHAEALPGLVARRKLTPSLQPDLRALRFSPDGKYLFAQDESVITVFAREGLAPLFQIPAAGAKRASFSADSRQLSFFASPAFGSPRVETWSVANRSSIIHEVFVPEGCAQSALSPDGTTLACLVEGENYNGQLTLDLRVIDVATDRIVVEKSPMALLSFWEVLVGLPSMLSGNLNAANLAFSPDGRVLLAASEEVAQGFDVQSGASIPLDGSIKQLIRSPFAFLDDRRLVGKKHAELQILSFPDGKPLVEPLPLGVAIPRPVTRGDFLVVGPLKNAPAGILNFRTKAFFTLTRARADVFDDVFVAERPDGRVALYTLDGTEQAVAALPPSRLETIRAGAISPDGRWVAVSADSRGAVWDVPNGRRVLHLRGFESAWLGEPDALHAVLREETTADRSTVRFDLAVPPAYRAAPGVANASWSQDGRYVLAVRKAKENPRRDVTIEARDLTKEGLLWSRKVPYDAATRLVEPATGQLVLTWPLADDTARKVIGADPAWQPALQAIKDRSRAVCFEITDVATGTVKARVAIDSTVAQLPYLRAVATADRLYVQEFRGRLLAYSFDGKLVGRAFARNFAVSSDGTRVAAGTAAGRMAILDSRTLAPVRELAFDSTVCLASFGTERLFVVTTDQTLYTFDVK